MINPSYLDSEVLDQLRSYYLSDTEFPSVSLAQFLEPNYLTSLQESILQASFDRDNRPLITRRWTSSSDGLDLSFLSEKEFATVFQSITDQSWGDYELEIVKFSHKDYQIINDAAVVPAGYDLILDLSPKWDDEWGGFFVYTDGEGEFFTVPQQAGTLSILYREENIHRFVKYVNCLAENNSRYFLILRTKDER